LKESIKSFRRRIDWKYMFNNYLLTWFAKLALGYNTLSYIIFNFLIKLW
jgi:hypothetical protein